MCLCDAAVQPSPNGKLKDKSRRQINNNKVGNNVNLCGSRINEFLNLIVSQPVLKEKVIAFKYFLLINLLQNILTISVFN